jgi:hypothetical protein
MCPTPRRARPRRRRNKNLGDGIDYGQQHYECLGELISETLQLLEQRGGEDAFINIKARGPAGRGVQGCAGRGAWARRPACSRLGC